MAIDLTELKNELNRKKVEDENKPKSEGHDIKWVSVGMDEGDMLKFIVLPPTEGRGLPGYINYAHYNIPTQDGKIGNIHCVKPFGIECPVCSLLDKHKDHNDIIRDYQAVGKSYFNIYILDIKTKKGSDLRPGDVAVLSGNDFQYWYFLELLNNPDIGDYTDPMQCFAFEFVREKSNRNGIPGKVKRTLLPKSRILENSQEKIDEILSKRTRFDIVWRQPDDEYIRKSLQCAANLEVELSVKIKNLGDINKATEDRKIQEAETKANEIMNHITTNGKEVDASDNTDVPFPQDSKIEGKPACFGDYTSSGDDKEKIRRCLACMDDDECREYSKK